SSPASVGAELSVPATSAGSPGEHAPSSSAIAIIAPHHPRHPVLHAVQAPRARRAGPRKRAAVAMILVPGIGIAGPSPEAWTEFAQYRRLLHTDRVPSDATLKKGVEG